MKIYHNPRCKKSRETLAILEENNIEPEIIKYLKTPPSEKELKAILAKLDMPAEKLVRKTEKIYKEKYKGKELSEDDWLEAMVEHPKLIQRPIVIKGDKAIVGRPPENVNALI
jgi:arsenate reductase